MYKLSDYNYDLPKKLIAQTHAEPADESKLLFWDGSKIQDFVFKNIIDLIDSNTVIFFNNSKVIKARIPLKNCKTTTQNGEIKSIKEGELFFLKQISKNSFDVLVYPGKKIKPGTTIIFDDLNYFFVEKNSKDGRIIVSKNPDFDLLNFLEKNGEMPLPPYIKYSKSKEKTYQPIVAQNPGSVASPTATLHFTKNLLEKIKNKGISLEYTTLHIGLGTFKIVNTEDIRNYDIHEETLEIDLDIFDKIANIKTHGKKILGVGTTATRSLESLPYIWMQIKDKGICFDDNTKSFWNDLTKNISLEKSDQYINDLHIFEQKIQLETKLFIFPGYKFSIIDELITNFHLPKSSLLMLVAGFMGYENMFKCYQHAIQNNYRFFSFGDAMYIKI